jgi:hypothetical protein
MTTVDRLYKKGLLNRVEEGRAFRYTPRHTPEELQRVTALESIRQLLGSGGASALPLSYLVEALSTTTRNCSTSCNFWSNANAANFKAAKSRKRRGKKRRRSNADV